MLYAYDVKEKNDRSSDLEYILREGGIKFTVYIYASEKCLV